jgi:esterase/lipase superfamily enzyme
MFIITNRNVVPNADGLDKLGPDPNPKGPNELRIAEATRNGGSWDLEILPDVITDPAMLKSVGITREKDETGKAEKIYASKYAAQAVLDRVESGERNLLLFVHGFNNDIKAVLDRAHRFEQDYGVEVICFSWPANGGGVQGVVSYKSDKRDAQASVGALDRVLAKMHEYLTQFNAKRIAKIEAQATAKYPDDAEKWDQFFTRASEKGCPFTVNMVLHSMGNYIYKHVLQSSVYRGDLLLFDNVVMAAADANNPGHAEWIDRIQCRRRLYITINEDDSALMASRMKAGEEQQARLGHYPYNLYSRQAVYVDFTDAAYVGDSHAYFEGTPLKNKKVMTFFKKAFNGLRAETDLAYHASTNTFRLD